MRKTLLIVSLLSALLLPTSSQAAKWVNVGQKDSARIEVDASSVNTATEGKLRLWHRESYTKPRIPDSGAFSFSRVTTLTEFQCDKRLAATIQRSYNAADGTELKTESFDNRVPKPIVPDSILETVARYACKRPKPVVVEEPEPPPVMPAPVVEAHGNANKPKNGRKTKEEPLPEPPYWSYAGKTGAEKWGSLGPEYANCSLGRRQSPIDIRKTILADLPAIDFSYKRVPLTITDNGHSIKIDTTDAGGITVDGERYELTHFLFHKPSEEQINGKTYAMSVQLVHQSKTGKLAVVAIMMEAGKEQSLIRILWSNLPLEQNKSITHPEVRIDPSLLIPTKRNYYTFIGSLTTPPCTEDVLWLVLKTPLQISKEQLAGFGTIYKNNIRPVQPVYRRVIKESR